MTDSLNNEASGGEYESNGHGSPEHLFGELIPQFVRMDVYGPGDDEVEVHSAPVFVPHDSTSPVVVYVLPGAEDDELIAECILAAAIRWEESSLERIQWRERGAPVPRRRPRNPNRPRRSHGTRHERI
jgi:hypothetical protein